MAMEFPTRTNPLMCHPPKNKIALLFPRNPLSPILSIHSQPSLSLAATVVVMSHPYIPMHLVEARKRIANLSRGMDRYQHILQLPFLRRSSQIERVGRVLTICQWPPPCQNKLLICRITLAYRLLPLRNLHSSNVLLRPIRSLSPLLNQMIFFHLIGFNLTYLIMIRLIPLHLSSPIHRHHMTIVQ